MQQIFKYLATCFAAVLVACCVYAQPNITRVEYYIDADPGYNNATALTITAGTNLTNLAININPTTLSQGVHILGVRAKDANGAWSQDNRWIFAKPFSSDTTGPGPLPNISRVEYYLDTDPGYGAATALSIGTGNNLANLTFNIDPATLTEGVHVLGVRSKDANGAWSQDNRWLFAKPFASDTVGAGTAPNLSRVEYYLDTDPGYGNGVALAINNVTSLNNFSLPVNISTLAAGSHKLFIRSKDANKAWSQDNVFDFTIGTAVNGKSIVVNSVTKKTLCQKDGFSVSYQAAGTYNAGNIFNVQISDAAGSFTAPTTIGSFTGTGNSIVSCVLPPTVTAGSAYRVRVSSTNPVVTGITGADVIVINALPATPTVSASGATTFCAGGSVTLTSTAATTYLWSNGATTQSISTNVTGSYSVTVSNASGCSAASTATAVTVNPNPVATITAGGGVTNLCPGTTVTLTASAATSYLWSNGATTPSITVTAAGSYSVTVTNATNCSNTSAATVVSYSSCPVPTGLKATVTSSTGATLKYKAASCAAQYQLQYRKISTATWTTVTVTGLSYKAKNLLPSTSYEWQVATVCQVSPQILSAYKAGTNFTTTASPNATFAAAKAVEDVFNAMVFPNPAKSSATLQISGANEGVTVNLTDVTGKVLWQSQHTQETQLKIPVDKLAAGVYIVSVNNGKEIRTLKLIKE